MATTTSCDALWLELFKSVRDHNFKLAIFQRPSAGLMGKGTAGYAATVNGCAEVSYGNPTYNGGGLLLTKDASAGQADGTGANVRVDAATHKVGLDWAPAVFSNVTITGIKAGGFYAMIYDDTAAGKPAYAIAEFTGSEPEFTNDPVSSTFTIPLPFSGTMTIWATS